jgi:RNA polymerase sigma factor (sigma-70 family)
MADRSREPLLGTLCQLLDARTDDHQTDGQLLERFAQQQEETAFALLVRRHGPLVLGVCRRMLGNTADAADAFQATFLILVRRAGGMDRHGSLAGWLYRVAYRVAVRARARAARRRDCEREACHMRATSSAEEPADPDLGPVLTEEVSRLPEKYRSPIVLCYLEGKTQAEAARQLRWPLGTVRGRVARARDLLRQRLTRRGLTLSGGMLVAALSSNEATAAVSTTMLQATVRAALLEAAGQGAAAGAFSAPVTRLGEAVLREMAGGRLKLVLAVLLAVVVAGGAGALVFRATGWVAPRAAPPLPEAPALPRSEAIATRSLQEFQHDGPVRAVSLAPDGKTLASAGADIIRLWDLTPRRHHHHLARPKVRAVAFAPHRGYFASGDDEETVHLWMGGFGHAPVPLDKHYHGVPALAFSPDAATLATGGPGEQIRLWDVATPHPKLIHSAKHPRGVAALAFSADGHHLASGGEDGKVRLWDRGTNRPVQEFQGHEARVASVVFLPDGRLASGSTDGTIRLWQATRDREVGRWRGHVNGVTALVVSGDGRTLVSGGADGTICLRQASTGKEVRRFEGHPGGVSSLSLSPNGKLLASGGQDRRVCLWELTLEW